MEANKLENHRGCWLNGGTYVILKFEVNRTILNTTDTFQLYRPSGLPNFYVRSYQSYADILKNEEVVDAS